jgi:hypothetical protein
MDIAPVFHQDFEVLRITRYFDTFILDIWFKSEDITHMEVTEEQVRDIGQTIGHDIQGCFKKCVKSAGGLVVMEEFDIDYGLYIVNLRSPFFGNSEIKLRPLEVESLAKRIEDDLKDNAAGIVEEIDRKKVLDTRGLDQIEKTVFKTKK